MKCPYRVGINKKIYKEYNATIIKESVAYDDCYGEKCPFYCDDGTHRDPYCIRVENETGGTL